MVSSQAALLKLQNLKTVLEQQITNNCTGQGVLAGVPRERLALIAGEVESITNETMAELERVKHAIRVLEAGAPDALEEVLALLMPERPPLLANLSTPSRTLH